MRPVICTFILAVLIVSRPVFADETSEVTSTGQTSSSPIITGIPEADYSIFDDKALINGYARKIANAPKDILLSMINDDALPGYRKAAAVRVFRERFAGQVVTRERTIVERILLRQLERGTATFVQVEIMQTLVVLDRYRYFDAMVPALIQKIDHYDLTVSALAYDGIVQINQTGNQRPREARVIFNTLRKIFFLIRKRLPAMDETDIRLKEKLELLRWSVKVLGTDELKKLPREVINLM